MAAAPRIKQKVIPLALGHMTVDIYGSFLPPLLPLFIEKMDLSLTLAGTLASILTIADGLSQPFFGLVADRLRRPLFVLLGPVLVALLTSLMGLSPGYLFLAVVLVLSGLGRSAYHPQAAALVGRFAGSKRGFGMSLFSAAGNIGFASGPALVALFVSIFGLPGTLYTFPIGVLISAMLFGCVYRDWAAEDTSDLPFKGAREIIFEIMENRGPLMRLWSIVVIRSLAYFGFFTFLPILFVSQGYSSSLGGIFTSVFLFGGAAGGIIGGMLSDRLGEKRIIMASLFLSGPLFLVALSMEGWGMILFLILAGMCLLSSAPVTISLAQRYTPGSMATASAMMLGFGWGTGGLLVTVVGFAADRLGALTALTGLTFLPLVASLIASRLKEQREVSSS